MFEISFNCLSFHIVEGDDGDEDKLDNELRTLSLNELNDHEDNTVEDEERDVSTDNDGKLDWSFFSRQLYSVSSLFNSSRFF